jgi:hypothetical protein
MTTTWKITQLDRQTSDGFITTAYWTATAVDGNYTTYVYGTCGFPTAEPTIPYANVTETEVLDWIWANGVDKETTETNLAAQIEAKKNPVIATGVPW